MHSSSRLLKAFNFVWWSIGLFFIGVAVSRFVWPKKVVDVEMPPPTVAFSKDVCPETLRTTLLESGQMPPDILWMRVNISTRTECKDEVQLALVASLEHDTTDLMTDHRIEKSNLFSPISEQRELRMHVTEGFLRSAAPQRPIMLALMALPAHGLTPSDWSKVTTVNQAVRNGGSVLSVLGFQLRCKCPGKKGCSISLERFHRVPSPP